MFNSADDIDTQIDNNGFSSKTEAGRRRIQKAITDLNYHYDNKNCSKAKYDYLKSTLERLLST